MEMMKMPYVNLLNATDVFLRPSIVPVSTSSDISTLPAVPVRTVTSSRLLPSSSSLLRLSTAPSQPTSLLRPVPSFLPSRNLTSQFRGPTGGSVEQPAVPTRAGQPIGLPSFRDPILSSSALLQTSSAQLPIISRLPTIATTLLSSPSAVVTSSAALINSTAVFPLPSSTTLRSTLPSEALVNQTVDSNSTLSGLQEALLEALDPRTANDVLPGSLFVFLLLAAAGALIWCLWTRSRRHVRHVACLNPNGSQAHFAHTSNTSSFFKRRVLYAPIFKKRVNREFSVGSGNAGTLPTRLQFLFISAYILANLVFCVLFIPWHDPSPVGALTVVRNRTGVMAVYNMIPLFILAGRNNPLISLLHISFGSFNFIHRWIGRIVIAESIVHVLAFLSSSTANRGFAATMTLILQTQYLAYGFVSVCCFVLIGFLAQGLLRHGFYEIFKFLHVLLALAGLATLWAHRVLDDLPLVKWLIFIAPIWILDHIARVTRVVYFNFGSADPVTVVRALPGEACRVTVTLARPWPFRPGQHAYLYMPSISLFQSHPFSVAWCHSGDPAAGDFEDFTMPNDQKDESINTSAQSDNVNAASRKQKISFVIKARGGFTRALWKAAAAAPGNTLYTTCYVEGPYGGHQSLVSYGTVVMVAGGIGITQSMPHLRELVAGYGAGSVAARRIVLIWIVQTPEMLEWIRPWMMEVLGMEKRRDCLKVLLFVTKQTGNAMQSPSSTVHMFPGRPNISKLIASEVDSQIGAMGVTVCGPGALSDEVRMAVRDNQYRGNIDYIQEAFTW